MDERRATLEAEDKKRAGELTKAVIAWAESVATAAPATVVHVFEGSADAKVGVG